MVFYKKFECIELARFLKQEDIYKVFPYYRGIEAHRGENVR